MNSDLLALILFNIVVVAYSVIRSRRIWRGISTTEISKEVASPASHNHAPPVFESEEERLATQAAEVKTHWDEERRKVENSHYAEMKPIRRKLEKAKALVENSGVGNSACAILRIMWHWPSWSQRPDWKMPFSLEKLSGGEPTDEVQSTRRGKWLEWSWAQHLFRLELTITPNYVGAGTNIGHLKLSVDGEMTIELDVSQDFNSEYDDWKVYGVSAFKAGPWMAQLNDLAGRLEIADRQWLRDHDKKLWGEKAAHIQLPETEA